VLKELQRKHGGKLLQINTPDNAPPPLPRVVLSFQDCITKISFDRFSISTNPPSHVADNFEKSNLYASNRTNPILSELIRAVANYSWTGIIAELEFPKYEHGFKSGLDAIEPIFSKLINIDRKGRKLGSFNLQFGIQEDSHFINYTLTGYESRNFVFKPEKMGFQAIDLQKFPIKDCGVQITLDINNRPSLKNSDPLADQTSLFQKLSAIYNNLCKDLNIEGLL
jgi:hypothetical protein